MPDVAPESFGFLKSVKIQNFKSFLQTTTIYPLRNFCAIIGPNGSGKSNLFDAICFALGEKPQNIRVNRLADLESNSFNNDSSKLPSYVELTIKNPNNLDLELKFKRQILNSIKSQWYIDNSLVSSKEYEETLENLGLSLKSNYFVVYQGTVESIATKSPMELTELFENVSGSKTFKQEYDILKLDLDDNDKQFKTTISERKKIFSEHKLASLAKQDFENYHKMKSDIENKRQIINHLKLYMYDEDIRSASKELKNQKQELQMLNDKLSELKEKVSANDYDEAKKSKTLDKLEKQISTLSSKLKELKMRQVSFENLIMTSKTEKEKYNEAKKKLQDDIIKDRTNIQELEAKLMELNKSVKEKDDISLNSLSQSFPSISSDSIEKFSQLNLEFKQKTKSIFQQKESNHHEIIAKQNELDAINKKCLHFNLEKNQFVCDKKSFQNMFDAQTCALVSTKNELDILKKNTEELNNKILNSKQTIRQLNSELNTINDQLANAHGYNVENLMKNKRSSALKNLKENFETIHGRVHMFCEPRNSKYNLAVARILGQHLNSIIIDSFSSAKAAIEFLKAERIYHECFLPLDVIEPYIVNINVKKYSEMRKIPLLIDVIKFDEKYYNIFSHLCKDTLVCKTAEQARQIAYETFENGQKLTLKTVSYEGVVFKKSGLITGGISDLKSKAQIWDESQIDQLIQNQSSINLEIRKNIVVLSKEKDLSENNNKIKHLNSRKDILENSLKSIRSSIQTTELSISSLDEKINQLDVSYKKVEQELEILNQKNSKINATLKIHFIEIFKGFCQKCSIDPEYLYESIYEKSKQDIENVKLKIKNDISEIESKLRLLKSKNTEQKIDFIEKNIADMQLSINKNEDDLIATKNSISNTDEKLLNLNSEKKKIEESISISNKESSSLVLAIRNLQLSINNSKKKMITLEMDLVSKHSIKDEEIKRLNRENQSVKFVSKIDKEIDYSCINKYISKSSTKNLSKILKSMTDEYETISNNFSKITMPHNVYLKKYDELCNDLKNINSKCDTLRKNMHIIDDKLNEIKSKRIETFRRFFDDVSQNLSNIYRQLSKSQTGQAYLSLINSQEPYLDGILYSCIVPGKHYTYLENLSGGERSLAALALIFSIAHASKNNKKSHIFILDEVCAALDASNVQKLADFISHESKENNKQFILISHKLDMYHNANILFGLYKTDQTTKILSLDLESYNKEQ